MLYDRKFQSRKFAANAFPRSCQSMLPTALVAIAAALVFIAGALPAQSADEFETDPGLFYRNPADPVTAIVPDIKAPGRYELTATFSARRITLRAMLYVPAAIPADERVRRPVVVFFHGGGGDLAYYSKKVDYMIRRADRKKFILLSVQNYWGVGDGMSVAALMYHSARGSAAMLETLIENATIGSSRIFTTGHSSGGLTAVATALYRPDLFAGFGANKANFYESDLIEICIAGEAVYFERVRRGLSVRTLHDLKGTSTLGGAREAERVKYQTPALRGYVGEVLGVPLATRDFPNEGHDYSEADFDFFWSIVE